jgi:hypothetical protein
LHLLTTATYQLIVFERKKNEGTLLAYRNKARELEERKMNDLATLMTPMTPSMLAAKVSQRRISPNRKFDYSIPAGPLPSRQR